MRRSLFISLLALAALLFGCEPETYLFVDEKPLSFTSDGGSVTIDLVANKDWTAMSDNIWCTVTPASGGGDAVGGRLTVTCNKNESYDVRTATITISCAEMMKRLTVSQSQNNALIISQKEFSLDEKGGTISITVQSNVSYLCEIIEGSSWIDDISTRGLSTQTKQFTVKENTTYDAREGKIRFSDSTTGLSEDVVVRQSQNGAIIITQKEYNVGSDGGSITVEVKSNVDYKYQIIEGSSWISAVNTKGLTMQNVQFSIKENTTYDAREGKIRFSDSTTGLSEDVVVRQSQNGAIIITQKEYNVDSDGGTITVEVKSNVDYKYQIIEGYSWISAVNTKGLTTQNVQFSIKENTSYDDREGKIRFSDSGVGMSDTVVVKQSRKGVVIIEKKEYMLSYEAQMLEISVLENTDYEVKIATNCQGWMKKVETKGLQTSSFTLSIEENEQKDREGVVYVTTSSDVITLKIRQADGTITIPDANFRRYCVTSFDKNGDGVLSHKEAANVTRIDVSTENIESLQGIEFFSNLKTLYCSGKLDSNQMIYIGKLTSLDVSKNSNLTDLDCGGNQLTSLNVGNNLALIDLDCYYNKLTSLDVGNNTALRSLRCDSNKLTNLPVANNTALEYLDCGNNQLTSLDISRNTLLKKLRCFNNQLTSLNVANNTALELLDCYNNQLAGLNMANNTALKHLDCHNNQLTSLNVANNTALELLYCHNNQLASLNVANNTTLKYLRCDYNQLTNLNVVNNTALISLRCNSNQLTSLDVSKNTLLETLYCNNTTMTVLYLAQGQTFKESNWYSGTKVRYVTGQENGHDWVDLGLPSGLKWATCNVGASSSSDYGSYYAWGETSTKSIFDWSTYKWCNGSENTLTKYNTKSDYGSVDNKTVLEMSDDAARANWGGSWRMPTESEFRELLDYCTWTWTTQGGKNGYKVSSKTNGNSIFLLAAGYRSGGSLLNDGSDGLYRSSSLTSDYPSYSRYLTFNWSNRYVNGSLRFFGFLVRPVCGESVRVSNVSLSKTQLSLNVGGSEQLIATVYPSNAAETGVRWSSNNSSVATVDSKGLVSAKQGGTATITATTIDGGYTSNCYVTVTSNTTGYENGHQWVDLGLPSGLKWATCNVGASSPSDYGNYYPWGETSTKNYYDWSTYKWCNGSGYALTKYNTSSDYGIADNRTTLERSDDAASANWGGKWRMPTDAELTELINKCTWTWTTQNGVNGRLVTGPNGSSIFLPAAGYRHAHTFVSADSIGHYWSSSIGTGYPGYAWSLRFYSELVYRYYGLERFCGGSVRPVTY